MLFVAPVGYIYIIIDYYLFVNSILDNYLILAYCTRKGEYFWILLTELKLLLMKKGSQLRHLNEILV